LKPHGPTNTLFWILSIDSTEFSTAFGVVEFLNSKRHPTHTPTFLYILSKRKAATRSSFEENRASINQIRLGSPSILHTAPSTVPPTIILPIVNTIISTPTKPSAPAHIGELKHNLYYAEWKEALFKNYTKMLNSGTWSAPILCSLVPPSKTILTPGASFKLKTTDINNTYELYCCTCSNGANMKKIMILPIPFLLLAPLALFVSHFHWQPLPPLDPQCS
jgi:hypothetical protein